MKLSPPDFAGGAGFEADRVSVDAIEGGGVDVGLLGPQPMRAESKYPSQRPSAWVVRLEFMRGSAVLGARAGKLGR